MTKLTVGLWYLGFLLFDAATALAGGTDTNAMIEALRRRTALIQSFTFTELREYQRLQGESAKCNSGLRAHFGYKKCKKRTDENLTKFITRVEQRLAVSPTSAPSPTGNPQNPQANGQAAFDAAKCKDELENIIRLTDSALKQIETYPASCAHPLAIQAGPNCESFETVYQHGLNPAVKTIKEILYTKFLIQVDPKIDFTTLVKHTEKAANKAILKQCGRYAGAPSNGAN